MDILSLYYFSEVAKDLNITKTAARLFISQQTLSNHIQRMEKHFGAELLHRRPTMALTTAGEFVLSFAQVVEKEHTNLQDILFDIEKQERGTIRFGASITRGTAILPEILPTFFARYPNVEVRFVDAVSSKICPLVAKGELDFAVVLDTDPDPKFVSQHLIDDQLYLCVSDHLLCAHYGDHADDIKRQSVNGAELKNFSKLPFAMLTNYLGRQIQTLFYKNGITPISRFTSSNLQAAAPLCSQALCACFLTQMSLVDHSAQISDDVNIFPLLYNGQPMSQPFSLIRMKDRYLSHYSKYFIEILSEHFDNLAPIDVSRCV